MRLRQHHAVFAGIAVLSAGAAGLEDTHSRLFTVVYGHSFALLALSLPLLGAAMAATLMCLFPAIGRRPWSMTHAAYLAGAAAAATVVALIVLAHARPFEGHDTLRPGVLVAMAATSLLPYVLSALAVGAASRLTPRAVVPISVALLVGAASGVVFAVEMLGAGALRVGLMVPILDALASIGFYVAAALAPSRGSGDEPSEGSETPALRRPSGNWVSTFVLAAVVLLAGDVGSSWLRLPPTRTGALDRAELSEWTPRGLVTVDRLSGSSATVRIDSVKVGAVFDTKASTVPVPEDLVTALHAKPGAVLVLEPGGGQAVKALLHAKWKPIHVVEPSTYLVDDVMRGHFAERTGQLYDRPEVEVEVGESRSALARSQRKYQGILVPRAERLASGAAVDCELCEDDLFTREGMQDLVAHLSETGTVVITVPDELTDRLLALMGSAFPKKGYDDAATHLFGVSEGHTVALLAKRASLTHHDVAALHGSRASIDSAR